MLDLQYKKAQSKFHKIFYIKILLFYIAIVSLEILPGAVRLPFADGPNQKIIFSFSYFDLTPFGYADYLPLFTVILTIWVIVKAIIGLIKKKSMKWLGGTCVVCGILNIVFSFLPLFIYGFSCMSFSNYGIAGLSLISVILVIIERHRFVFD